MKKCVDLKNKNKEITTNNTIIVKYYYYYVLQ